MYSSNPFTYVVTDYPGQGSTQLKPYSDNTSLKYAIDPLSVQLWTRNNVNGFNKMDDV